MVPTNLTYITLQAPYKANVLETVTVWVSFRATGRDWLIKYLYYNDIDTYHKVVQHHQFGDQVSWSEISKSKKLVEGILN